VIERRAVTLRAGSLANSVATSTPSPRASDLRQRRDRDPRAQAELAQRERGAIAQRADAMGEIEAARRGGAHWGGAGSRGPATQAAILRIG
jgi:hypothetical protein